VEEYGRNFRSLWDTVEAFGGLPGVHKGLVEGLLTDTSWVCNVNNMMMAEGARAKEDTSEAVKTTLLVSGADKQRYGKLKEELANNNLMGIDQYPNTFDKALRILWNYETSKVNASFRGSPNATTGVAFIQQGGRRGQGQGGCGRGSRGMAAGEADEGRGASNTVSVITGMLGVNNIRTIS
jgi:hypothetical protein